MRYFYSLFLLLIITNTIHAQYDLRFDALGTEHGLSQNTINSIYQDSYGFVWFGTIKGVNRYDGYSFEVYLHQPGDSLTLCNDYVNTFYETADSTLWIGTYAGLSRYNRKLNSYVSYYHQPDLVNSLPNNNIISLCEDNSGVLWVATESGLAYYNKADDSFVTYSFEQTQMNSYKYNSIVAGAGDMLWLGTEKNGLFAFDTRSKTISDAKRIEKTGVDEIHITKILMHNQNLWLGTMNGGVWIYNTNDKTVKPLEQMVSNENEIPQKNTTDIVYSHNCIWIATWDGLYRYYLSGNDIVRYKNTPLIPGSLRSNALQTVCFDYSGVLWIGTRTVGVNRTSSLNKQFYNISKHSDSEDELSNKEVYSITEDNRNNLWVATLNGLNKLDKNTWKSTQYFHQPKNKNSLNDNRVWTVFFDSYNRLWVGTSLGFCLYRPETDDFKRYYINEDEPNSRQNKLNTINQTKDGRLLLATYEGFHIYNPRTGKFKSYIHNANDKNSVSNNRVWQAKESPDGSIFIATDDGFNVFYPKNEIFKVYKNNPKDTNSIINNSCYSIYVTEKGTWLGTQTGLSFFHYDGYFTNYPMTLNNLPRTIYGIQPDNSGNLWLNTNDALARFSTIDYTTKSYSYADGVQAEYSFASHRDEEGWIYIGGIDGVDYFFPDSIKDNQAAPKTVITRLKILNKPIVAGQLYDQRLILQKNISLTDEISLSYKDYSFSLDFAALHYVAPLKNKYAYMLEDLDTTWFVVNGDIRTVTYTNLSPGKYTFKVKAANSDMVWNENPTKLQITITPPFWRTWWFALTVFIVVIGGAIAFYNIRVGIIKRQNRLLEEKVNKRTAELLESNVMLEERQEEILQINDEIMHQKELVDNKNSEIEKAYQQSQVVSEFGQKITSTLNIKDINNIVFSYIRSLMDVSAFGVGFYNEAFHRIEFQNFFEGDKAIKFYSQNLDEYNSLSAYTLKHKKVLFIRDIEKEYIKYVSELPKVIASQRPMSIIHIPLFTEKTTIGIMIIHSYRKNAFNKNDLNILQALASYITIALDNANAYRIVNDQHENITSSIEYALSIQQAMLPLHDEIQEMFDNFILYYPRNIVSGDFYWYTRPVEPGTNVELEKYFFAVVDCTGHGVPGAFMSLIGNHLLGEAIIQRKIYSPKQILDRINKSLYKTLNQYNTHNDDGMDICLYKVEKLDDEKYSVVFSGAKRPLIYYDSRKNKMVQIKGDVKGIGGTYYKSDLERKNVELELVKGDILYLTTDGYADQSDVSRKRFSRQKFVNLLGEIASRPMDEQQYILDTRLREHQGNSPQRDDITVWGIKL